MHPVSNFAMICLRQQNQKKAKQDADTNYSQSD
jgi:hypothetical protein